MKAINEYDEDLSYLGEETAQFLESHYGYSQAESVAMVTQYFHMFFDDELCNKLLTQTQVDDDLHHFGYNGLARIIHYTLGLNGEIETNKFIDWRKKNRLR